MMKVTIISLRPLSRIGGTEKACANFANLLHDKFEVEILIIFPQTEKSFFELPNDVKLTSLNLPDVPVSFKHKLIWQYRMIKALRRHFKSSRTDYVLSTGHGVGSMLPFAVAGLKTKAIACEHVVFDAVLSPYKQIRRLMYPFMWAIVVLTKSASRHYTFHKRLRIIPNSISPIPSQVSPLSDNIVLAIGRYDEGKNFGELIEVAHILKERGVEVKFRVVGQGELYDDFDNLIKKYGLEKSFILVPPTNKVSVEYEQASIYAMTSQSEALPMVLLEAKSYGLPIVSYACEEGPLSMIDDSKNGFLVEYGNRLDFADKVEKLLTDDNLRKEMGQSSRASVEEFSVNNVKQKWIELFQGF